MKKERIDTLLVNRELFDSREKAKRAVMAGLVYSGTERLDKPGVKIDIEAPLHVKGEVMPYVSRGGYKLEKALQVFDVHVTDKIMLDIGASTGGFTDCALQNGAKLVYALDVGYNQLAWKIRQHDQVVVMERTNFRYVKPEDLTKGLPMFASIDVSFISLRLIFPALKHVLCRGGDVVALVKPQFEAGRDQVGKKGIVKDPAIHKQVLQHIIQAAENEGYQLSGLDFSPITGGEGNIEFLLHLKWPVDEGMKLESQEHEVIINEVVEKAQQLV